MKLTLVIVFSLVCCLEGAALPEDSGAPALLSEPWKYDITVGQLMNRENLADGDRIQLVEEKMGCLGSNEIAISLELVNPITWWKAICMHPHTKPKYAKTVVEIQDNANPMTAIFSLDELDVNDLVIWKAKTFGIKKAMYRISDAMEELIAGHKYTFRWIADRL